MRDKNITIDPTVHEKIKSLLPLAREVTKTRVTIKDFISLATENYEKVLERKVR